jgi:hypothetical protein
MKRIPWPTEVYGSIEDYFPAEKVADENQIDPRADIPPAESVEEFDSSPERADEIAQEKPVPEMGRSLVAAGLVREHCTRH